MHPNLTARVPAVLAEPSWRGDAECRKASAAAQAVHFFAPSHFERKDEKDFREGQARALCRACPVLEVCREYSLAVQEPHGIWGGLNELERRRLLRKRAAEAQQRSA